MVPSTQSVLPIREVSPPTIGGMYIMEVVSKVLKEVLRKVEQEIRKEPS